MAIDPQLADTLNQTVTWYAESASVVGTYADPTWSAGTSITARVEWDSAIMQNARGEELIASARILTASAVNEGDRLLLPGESVPREVRAIAKATDEDGTVIYRIAGV